MGRQSEESERQEDTKDAGESSEVEMGPESGRDESRAKSRREVFKSSHRVECRGRKTAWYLSSEYTPTSL